jgi:hypothetical protein
MHMPHSSGKTWPIWFQFTVATGLGWVISNMIISLIPLEYRYPFTRHGIIVGITMGSFQWGSLRKHIDQTTLWIFLNLVVWTLAYKMGSWAVGVVFEISPNSYDVEIVTTAARFVAMGIIVGIGSGFLQQALVKGVFADQTTWIPTSLISWCSSFTVYSVYIYMAFAVPMNNGFLYTSSHPLFDLINILSTILYYGIGFIAGVITSIRLKNTYNKEETIN